MLREVRSLLPVHRCGCGRSLAAQMLGVGFGPTLAPLPMDAFLSLWITGKKMSLLGVLKCPCHHPMFPNLPDSKLPYITSINWKRASYGCKSQSVLDVLISGGACGSESPSRCPGNL